MSTPANFNGARPVIDVNDTAMLLIDHQSGLFQTVGDMPMPELRARAAALAKMASENKIETFIADADALASVAVEVSAD